MRGIFHDSGPSFFLCFYGGRLLERSQPLRAEAAFPVAVRFIRTGDEVPPPITSMEPQTGRGVRC